MLGYGSPAGLTALLLTDVGAEALAEQAQRHAAVAATTTLRTLLASSTLDAD
jgi:hypothetical protein